jgi:integrase
MRGAGWTPAPPRRRPSRATGRSWRHTCSPAGPTYLGLQAWVTELGRRRSRATVSKALQLASAVLRSAVRNRLIPFNRADEVRVPGIRQLDTAERIISRADLRTRLLPAVPERHRGVVAVGAGAGLRWGEAIGLREDAFNLDGARLSVIRTVIEVSGHTSFKPYPKSRAGRRTVPLPGWLVEIIREHLRRWPSLAGEPIFANEVGAPLRRTLLRSRIWRPSLFEAGMLVEVVAVDGGFEAQWTDVDEVKHTERLRTYVQAVQRVARQHAGGLRFHDLRHSYATWLVDDGVPPNMAQRVMGHDARRRPWISTPAEPTTATASSRPSTTATRDDDPPPVPAPA